MSQFAELFRAVKNEPKTSSGDNENKKPASVKTRKQIKPKDEKSGESKSGVAKKSLVPQSKAQMPISEKAAEGGAIESPARQEGKPTSDNPKKMGKSRDADYTQVLTYIRRDTHRQIKKVLIDDLQERDLSDLVEELLRGWLKKNL